MVADCCVTWEVEKQTFDKNRGYGYVLISFIKFLNIKTIDKYYTAVKINSTPF